MMPKALRKHEVAVPVSAGLLVSHAAKKQKLAALLVTEDDSLWSQVGADLSSGLTLKHLDSIDELIASTPSGQAGVVLWDARNHADPASVLSRLHLHSSRFAIIALDGAQSANAWKLPIQHRQVVAHVALPIDPEALASALENAQEEVNSRLALLGDGTAEPPDLSAPKKSWLIPGIAAGVLVLAGAAYFFFTRPVTSEPKPTSAPVVQGQTPAIAPTVKSPIEADEKLDTLIEKAQQAMLDRHFIDPVGGSALSLYREVLVTDPDNGEARQGLQRLKEILITRVQSALDDRKFDVALQSLETARSIDATDPRLAALDDKMASLRSELGPAQIIAALNAQNFDRASQLIDEAARTKSLPPAKLAQLRDEVHKHRDEFDSDRLLKLIEARLQQDHVDDPHNDNAVYYLSQARQAGASGPEMQAQSQEVLKRLTQMAHSGIDQHRFTDVDHILSELRGIGSPAAIASLQHELSAARNQAAVQKPEPPQPLDLAQARLAQGKLTDPADDSALFYLNQLRTADPKNSALPQLATAVQGQILERARASLDAGDTEKAEAMAQLAAGIGASSDLDAFNEKLRVKKAKAGEFPLVSEQSLTRVGKLELQYPTQALKNNVEGWVEMSFTVAPDGSVVNVKVTNSTPPKTFDASAVRAMSHMRYQPVIQNGSAISVNSQVRIVYRVPN
jgi:TonB family protein